MFEGIYKIYLKLNHVQYGRNLKLRGMPFIYNTKGGTVSMGIEKALFTDDLWLKCMEILNGYKVVNCNEISLIYFNLLSIRKSGLWRINLDKNCNNNIVWSELMKLYPQVKKNLLEEKRKKE